jgi:hypothetical protein
MIEVWYWLVADFSRTCNPCGSGAYVGDVLIAGVTSSRELPWHITVPFGAEAPSGHVAYIWPEQSHLPPEACSPTTDDKARDKPNVVRLNPATF